MRRLGWLAVLVCCGCGDADIERARQEAVGALGAAVIDARLAEIQAAAELERDYSTRSLGTTRDGDPASGLLTALRNTVALMHQQLEWGTVERMTRKLKGQLEAAQWRHALVVDDIRVLEAERAHWPEAGADDEPRLHAAQQVLAARVATVRAGRAADLAKDYGHVGQLTPREVRRLTEHLRAIARVIGDAYGDAATTLGFETTEVAAYAEELELPIALAGLAGAAEQHQPLPDATLAAIRASCRRGLPRLDAWRGRLRSLAARQTRAVVVAAAGADGWLRAGDASRARAVTLCVTVQELLERRGEADRATQVAALRADLPADEALSPEACVALADALLGLVPEDEGRR